MEIWEIDKNLKVESTVTEPDLVWFNVTEPPFDLYGVFKDQKEGRFVRMPLDVAATVSPGVLGLARDTAGGRVRFCTDSPYIAIKAVMDNCSPMNHMPLTGQSGFDLCRKTEQGDIFFRTFVPVSGMNEGYSSGVWTDRKMYDYTINFPLYDRVKELYIAFKRTAHLEKAAPYRYRKPIVYYGSSITQGGCASRPGNAYQSIISRRLDVDYVNLGFSGSAKGEAAMADYLASLDMSIFVCDYDHNAPTPEHLADTLPPLYRKVRAAHPDLPIILASATDVLLKGDELPWNDRYNERCRVIRKTYEDGVAAGDKNLYFVAGADLFAGESWDACTVDGTHPNDLGFWRMAMGFEKVIKPLLK